MVRIQGQPVVGTESIFKDSQAKEFFRTHVVISRKDLTKIRALAKKRGFLKELLKLDVKVFLIGE